VTEPAAGSTIDLGPAGASITVRVTPTNGAFFPWAVRVDHDGVSTTETYNGGSPYTKGITLNATPSGNRTSSRCAASRSKSAAGSRARSRFSS